MVMDLNVEIRIESIEQVFSMSRNRDQSSEVDYNKCVYPYKPKVFIKRLEKGKLEMIPNSLGSTRTFYIGIIPSLIDDAL